MVQIGGSVGWRTEARVRVLLVYDSRMAQYRFAPPHPFLPERFTLAVELMRDWDLLGEGDARAGVLAPEPATEEDLLLVHTADYIATVKEEHAATLTDEAHGLGYGDTPRFPNMHEAAALTAGGTVQALELVVRGECLRAFNPAGGLHHAHADRAAGFCVYNDCAVAIARATAKHSGLRVAYVDIDAHHGDGVEEAFRERADVLTISLHESGRYLYPGTGSSRDVGAGPGLGFAINVPMPPGAGPTEYLLAFDRVVEPALRAFGPSVMFMQLGADSHRTDPLTHLGMTVAGHVELVVRLVRLADELCDGRLAATGGGGYEAFSATPRMWACDMAVLLGVEPPLKVPAEWLELSVQAAEQHGIQPIALAGTFDEAPVSEPSLSPDEILRLAEHAIEETLANSPLLAGRPR